MRARDTRRPILRQRPTRPIGILAASALVALAALPGAAIAQERAARLYARVSAGYDSSSDATVVDRSCDPAPLLIYFGCGNGIGERRIGVYGDFGRSLAAEVGFGLRAAPALRVELTLAHRPGFGLEGNANFPAAGDRQPVSADVVQNAAMARAFLDLAPFIPQGRVEPFLGAGVGRSRNRIDAVFYDFPGLTADPATTTTTGGRRWSTAWDASVGAAVRVGARRLVELSYRYSDFGPVVTDDGPIQVVRGTRHIAIRNVAGTRADLRAQGVYVGFRQEF